MRGVTLVEMLVVLLLLGIVTGISAVALGHLRVPDQGKRARLLEQGRTRAIHSGQAVMIMTDSGEVVRFLPDGRAIGAGMDGLTGSPSHGTR